LEIKKLVALGRERGITEQKYPMHLYFRFLVRKLDIFIIHQPRPEAESVDVRPGFELENVGKVAALAFSTKDARSQNQVRSACHKAPSCDNYPRDKFW
jgi:hypothetical protein